MAKGKSTLVHRFEVVIADDMAAPVGYAACMQAIEDANINGVIGVKYKNTTAKKVVDEAVEA